MRKFLALFISVVVLGSAIGVTWYLMRTPPQIARVTVDPPALLVEVAVAKREPITFFVKSQGTVSPRTRTSLKTEVSGQIIEVSDSFVAGGFFASDDMLVRIDPRNYQTSVKRATASVTKAWNQVQLHSALANSELEQWEQLQGREQNGSSNLNWSLRKPQSRLLAESQADLALARAELEKANGDLERTIIRAPYDGMISQKRADVGQYVNAGADLAETFAVDFAEVRLPVTQADLEYLQLPRSNGGKPIPAILETELGGRLHKWNANVVRTEGIFDTQSRVLYLVAQITDPYDMSASGQEILRIGAFVSAKVQGIDAGELFVIPRYSIQRGEILWVVDENMQMFPRKLSIVRSDDQFSYVDRGLEDGEQYCLTPIDQPLPGMRVRISG